MNVWRIGSRWDDYGDPDTTVLDIFIDYNIVFAGLYTEDILTKVKKGDIIAVSDGIIIKYVGKITSEPKQLHKFILPEREKLIKALKDKNINFYDEGIVGFKVKLSTKLKEDDTIKYRSKTFEKVNKYKNEIIQLKKQYIDKKEKNNIPKEYLELNKLGTKDKWKNKNKILDICIKQINIEKYQDIKKIHISNIPVDTQWIFFTGDNGFGKTTILRSIVVALRGKELTKNEELTNTFIELKNKNTLINVDKNNISFKSDNHINKFGSDYFVKFDNFVAYGAYRTKPHPTADEFNLTDNLFGKNDYVLNFESRFIGMEGLDKLKEERNNIINILKELIPNLEKIEVINEGDLLIPKVRYIEKDEEGKLLSPVYFNQLATGMRSIIGFVTDMIFRLSKNQEINNNLNGIVIIDEFDNHLHPKWQKMLVEKLTKIFPKVQFIVSTHSPIPLLGAPQNSVIIKVHRTKEDGITAERLDIDVSTLTPNSILTSPIFGFREIISSENKDLSKLRTEDDYDEILFNKEVERRLNKFVNENKSE